MLKVVGASWAQTQLSWCLIVTITLLGLISFYFGGTIKNEYDGKYAASAFWTKESGLRIEFFGQNNDPLMVKKGVARAYYRPDLSKNGWAVLEVETQAEFPDVVQAKAAGYLEGSLTWQMIYWHWKNTVETTCNGRTKFCDRLRKYLEENADEIKRIAKRQDETDPFWHQVKLFYTQLKALEDGWRFGVKRSRQDIDIPSIDFLWMNIMPDLRDFERKWNASRDFNPHKPPLSATFIKIINTNPIDFVLAQSTSGYYGSMLRIQKRYNFGFHETESDDSALVNGKIVEFTSYPASIYSQDDFYKVTKRNSKTEACVVGTELQNNNRQLWEKIMQKKDQQVLMGARAMAANRLANNSKHWYEVFSRNNSGTGNKQWLVVNGNRTSIEFGIVEQMPGIVAYGELSDTLLSTGYWIGSSNPCLKDTAYMSGNGGTCTATTTTTTMTETTGTNGADDDNGNPVAAVLRDGQQNVTDVSSLVELMRGPELSAIGRRDLLNVRRKIAERNAAAVEAAAANGTPETGDDWRLDIDKTFTGTLDLKIAAGNANGFVAASGPPFTADRAEVEPFRWSDSPIRHLAHHGHPDVWDFDVEGINWVWSD